MAPTTVRGRKPEYTHLTLTRSARFLALLAAGRSVTAAARLTGVSRETVYQHRRSDPDFARAWDDAIEQAADLLEDEAWRRGVEGVTTTSPIYVQGELVGERVVMRYSDRLLLRLLEARRPERYKRGELAVARGVERERQQAETAPAFNLDALSDAEVRLFVALAEKATGQGAGLPRSCCRREVPVRNRRGNHRRRS